MYHKTISKVRKHKSELAANTGFKVEFVEIVVMINSSTKWYERFETTSPAL